MARRPGTFALVVDCATGQTRERLIAPEGHHFYGHAAFSGDGRYLFTTENAYGSGDGRIGVWDRAAGFKRVSEFSSGGVGPHEVIMLPDGNLAVANGGIRTHPHTGREKLNLDTMRSNLTLLTQAGEIKDQAQVPHHMRLNSLRHIAALPDGTVGCGLQWQGDIFETPVLLAIYSGQGQLGFVEIREPLLRTLKGYIGSIAGLSQHQFIATAPRGDKAIVFDRDKRVLATMASIDVCGVASSFHGNSLVTNGIGQVYRMQQTGPIQLRNHGLAFDNHLVGLPSRT